MYSGIGRNSIPPEHLGKATMLIVLYQFCERLRYDLPFNWFFRVNITDSTFDCSTFSKK